MCIRDRTCSALLQRMSQPRPVCKLQRVCVRLALAYGVFSRSSTWPLRSVRLVRESRPCHSARHSMPKTRYRSGRAQPSRQLHRRAFLSLGCRRVCQLPSDVVVMRRSCSAQVFPAARLGVAAKGRSRRIFPSSVCRDQQTALRSPWQAYLLRVMHSVGMLRGSTAVPLLAFGTLGPESALGFDASRLSSATEKS